MGKDSNISQKEVLKTEKFNLYCKCDVKINKKYGLKKKIYVKNMHKFYLF